MNSRTRKLDDCDADFFTVPNNPVPAGGKVHWVATKSGARLRNALWYTDQPRRGTVVVVPGKSEYIEKYFCVVGELLTRGFDVLVMDLRSQGLSHRDIKDPLKGHLKRFDDFLDDIQAVFSDLILVDLRPPYVMLGHSMGGNITLRCAAELDLPVDAYVLSAPMTGIRGVNTFSPLMTLLEWVVRGLGLTKMLPPGVAANDPFKGGFEASKVTRDLTSWQINSDLLKVHPQMAQGAATYGWIFESLKSIKILSNAKYCGQIKRPVLLVSAERDQLVAVKSQAKVAHQIQGCRYEVIPDAEHELMMEQPAVRDAFWGYVDDFLAALPLGK